DPTRCPFILSQPHLQVSPKVFNWIEVRRLSWPWKDLVSMLFKPSCGPLGLVLWVIVLLKDDAGGIFAIECKAFLEFILQDIVVEFSINPPINLACISNSLPQHAAPHHQRSTTNFTVSFTSLSLKPSPAFFQAHLLPSDPSLLILVS